jgi:hypothetical protein
MQLLQMPNESGRQLGVGTVFVVLNRRPRGRPEVLLGGVNCTDEQRTTRLINANKSMRNC